MILEDCWGKPTQLLPRLATGLWHLQALPNLPETERSIHPCNLFSWHTSWRALKTITRSNATPFPQPLQPPPPPTINYIRISSGRIQAFLFLKLPRWFQYMAKADSPIPKALQRLLCLWITCRACQNADANSFIAGGDLRCCPSSEIPHGSMVLVHRPLFEKQRSRAMVLKHCCY